MKNLCDGNTINLKMIYDRFATVYDFLISPLEKGFLRGWRARAISLLPSSGPVLEIGAGTGLNFRHFSDSHELFATEPSQAMLRRAKSRASRARLIRADACDLPFQDDAFISALGTLVLCSIETPDTAIRELRRVVKDGGMFVFLEHVRPPGFLGRVFDFFNLFTERFLDDCFNRRTVEILERNGLTVEKVESHARGIVNIIFCRNDKSDCL